MEKNIYNWEQLFNTTLKMLPSSELVRNDGNLFTFSPIQDEIRHFENSTKGIFYKEQSCFRHVYPANLINPLSTPFQKLISFFSFEETDYTKFISTIMNGLLNEKINLNDIYLIVPDIECIQENLTLITNNLIKINPNRLKCKLPLNGNHYYIKLCVKYNDGLVTLMNFVLVDYKSGSNLSKIDSVLFPLRLDMIKEQVKSIFETSDYQKRYNSIYLITNNHELTHFIMGQLLSISNLLLEVQKLSHHKHGYAIKKLAREFFLECDYNNLSVTLILSCFPEVEEILESMYLKYSATMKNTIHKIRKSKKKIDAKYAHETLGIPYKLYQLEIDPTYKIDDLPNNFAYYRDDTRNIHTNPLESYK
ncbi:hypothetical protein [Streptococcus pluranimalium]|uniref:hypothetical protein n=1 Tax=Streptococcus pluranimalium TaxID=82348 RepID=UPI003BF8B010